MPRIRDEDAATGAANNGSERTGQSKRVNLNLPEAAVSEAFTAAKKKGWTMTQFFLFALALAVRIIEEGASGGQVLLKSKDGELRELLIPKW